MNKFLLFIVITAFSLVATAQEKSSLSPDDLNKWERLSRDRISDNGKWVSYEIKPYYGNTTSYITNYDDSITHILERTQKVQFSPNSDWSCFTIKLDYDSLSALNIKKTKKNKLPKDTLGILVFDRDTIYKFPKFKGYKTSVENSSWIAILKEKEARKKSEEGQKGKKKKKKNKKKNKKNDTSPASKKKKKYKTNDLIIFHPVRDKQYTFSDVADYACAYGGKSITFITHFGDSIAQSGIFVFNTETEKTDTLFFGEGTANKIAISREGNDLTYLFSQDTAKTKVYGMYRGLLGENPKLLVDTVDSSLPNGWSVSIHQKPRYSADGKHIWFGIAEKPIEPAKDSIPSNEKAKYDIWGYNDLRIVPAQLKRAESDKKKTFAAVYHIVDNKTIALADSLVDNVRWMVDGNGNYSIGQNSKPYQIGTTWEFPWGRDVYLIDNRTGKRTMVLKDQRYPYSISSNGRFVVYYQAEEKNWYSIDLQKDDTTNLTEKLTQNGQVFFYDDSETPAEPYPIGLTGWSQNDNFILINAKYEIWQIDPTGSKEPIAFTKGFADSTHTSFRYIRLNKEEQFIRLDLPVILKARNRKSNEVAYYIRYRNAERFLPLEGGEMNYYGLRKARNTERYIFRKEDFYHEPQVYYLIDDNANLEDRFKKNVQLSSYNPQKEEFWWGTAQQYHWKDEKGMDRKGLLFLPENRKESDSIPMVVYFYEKLFSSQYQHRAFRPSYSTISVPLYTSNGYAVFIPDITYGTGHPGQDAYNAIVSGVESLIEDKSFIDAKNIALQGQSWGGYQTAILITKTNMFKAAMAGAPVSNMTSAYGGIRWGSGISRMFQYEQTQSRIGTTLWEGKDLYIENSPVFHAPNIETPLLIMHNDKDGAVPWYQGIEMYMAMRRLNKPCWMINYNGEQHNLTQLANRMDLSKRMFQFFNHYLKGKPAPEWMTKGIPAVNKGKTDGFKLTK